MKMVVAPGRHGVVDTTPTTMFDDHGHRELELAAMVNAFNAVTEKLKVSHERLTDEVSRLRDRIHEKDLELERRARLAALGQMAAGVAHEVRNPLGSILLCADMLSKELENAPENKSLADQIVVAVRALDGIVGDVLAFAGPGTCRFQKVTLSEIMTDVVRLVAPRAVETGCRVRVDYRTCDTVVSADGAQIQRALLNLLFNAVDAANAGDVSVVITRINDEVQILISDTGDGIHDSIKERIFEPFFTTKDSGTGLGLAIVYRIVASHGGRVIVGDGPLGGAVFCVSLPAGQSSTES